MFFLFSIAAGSEIQVLASRPVVVAIDGVPTGIAGTVIDSKYLKAGHHKVEVRSFFGATLAELDLDVGDSEQIQLTWDRTSKTLYELDRRNLTSSLTPTAASALPLVRAEPTGSLTLTGLSDISGAATLQGVNLRFDSDTGGFLGIQLKPPVVELHITDNGVLRFHGAVDVVPHQHRICHLHFNHTAWTVLCRTEGPEHR